MSALNWNKDKYRQRLKKWKSERITKQINKYNKRRKIKALYRYSIRGHVVQALSFKQAYWALMNNRVADNACTIGIILPKTIAF